MKQIELLEKIRDLNQEEAISFYVNQEKVENRFDHENISQYKEADIENDLSYSLYSYIAASIIFKAQSLEFSQKGYRCFDRQWEDIIQKQKTDIFENSKVIKDNAMRLLSTFLMTNENVTLSMLLAKFAPLCVLKEISKNEQKARKIMRTFQRKKEVIFNQAILFSRSLYHSFLNKNDIVADKIHPDYEDLSNGIFSYEDELFCPSWQNAFSLDGYKKVVEESILKISNNFPLKDIKKISLLYLVKDIIATYTL